MLVLSRREKETVCFPTLGIAVEVVRIKGKTVRLGIDAPKKIRAVRGELEIFDVPDLNPIRFSDEESTEIRQNLDAANLAIHLAQNQLRQGLPDHADEVLEQAIACMRKLEAFLCGNHAGSRPPAAVRETGTRYQLDQDRVVMIVAANPVCLEISTRLGAGGYREQFCDNYVQAVKFLIENPQPRGLLVQSGYDEFESPAVEAVEFPGISGLRKSRAAVCRANPRLLGWFASEDDETAVYRCLDGMPNLRI
jgi:carbon storage regulator CsrA